MYVIEIMADRISSNTSTNINIPGIVMKSASITNKVSVCCLNMQSICARNMIKMDELRQIMSITSVDIVCICETWLNENKDSSLIEVNDYNTVRNDRIGKIGGGLLMYIKKCYKFKILESSFVEHQNHTIEFIFVEIIINSEKILVGLIYNHPLLDCSELIFDKVTAYGTRYDNILLLGDFNTNVLCKNAKTERFCDVLASLSLSVAGHEPTFFHSSGSSQLDLIITNDSSKILRFGQIDVPNMSQHDMIFAYLDFDINIVTKDFFFRDYKRIDPDLILTEFHKLDWDLFFSSDDPDILVELFNSYLKSLHDNCVPFRKIKNKVRHNPWFNEQIQKAMIDRDLAYKTWKNTKNPEDFSLFKRLRNSSNLLVVQAKRDYYNTQLSLSSSPNEFWKKFRELGFSRRSNQNEINFGVNEINNNFHKNFSVGTSDFYHQIPDSGLGDNFHFRCIQDYDVINSIYEVTSNAVGLDELPMKFIKLVLPILIDPLTYMFNCIIVTSKYPQAWKYSKIIPLKKKNNQDSLDNLRPISILCALSKSFERILKAQICSYLQANNLITPAQSGYRVGHSTKTAMLKIYDDIGVAIDRGGKVIMIFLDFSKAFDTISHTQLCKKLNLQFNFSISAVKLIESYLYDRKQAVWLNETLSNFLPVPSGVPQGSVLGPVLFSLYINDLPGILQHCSVHIFADDVQLYINCNGMNAETICRLINDDLNSIKSWADANFLTLNARKSQALQITRCNNVELLNLKIGTEKISFVENATSLGFIIQNDFQWDKFVLAQCGKVYAILRCFQLKGSFLNKETKLKIFKSFILPYFMSCDFLLSSVSMQTLDRLRVALNACVRFVFNLGRLDSVSHLQSELLGYPFYNFIKARSCLILHKIIITKCPAYLYEKLIPFRSERLNKYVLPPHSTALYARTLFVRGVCLWNSLPQNLRDQKSFVTFKKQCKEHFS